MQRLLYIFLWPAALLLLSGCAALHSPPTISRQSWESVQPLLHNRHTGLHQRVEQEAGARLADSESAELTSGSAEEILPKLLRSTRDQRLRPDARFRQLRQVISGQDKKERDAFAELATGALLEPDFEAKSPLYARYFQERYGASPTSSAPARVPFLVTANQTGSQIRWINPACVQEIHLLFSGKGTTSASRFGHTGLRLIIAPSEQADRLTANRNLYEHLVLGYRAHVDEFALSTLKALWGSYGAYLFAEPFMDAYSRYSVREFRPIYSVPLNLSRNECERMVRELSNIHWQFATDYTLLGRNCSSLLQDALRVSLPQQLAQQMPRTDYQRPDRFYDALCKTDIVNASVLNALDEAEKNGHYFPSSKLYYDKALKVVAQQMEAPAFTSLEEYTDRPPQLRINAITADKTYLMHLMKHDYTREAQLLLEQLAYFRGEELLTAQLIRYLAKITQHPPTDEALAHLSDKQRQFHAYLLSSVQLLETGTPQRHTGIPQTEEAILPPADYRHLLDVTLEFDEITELLNQLYPDCAEDWQRVKAGSYWTEQTLMNMSILEDLKDENTTSP